MKTLFLSISLLILSACATQGRPVTPVEPVTDATPIASETLYRCAYKYDSKYNIEFLGSKKSEYHPPSLPELTVFHIVDIHGVKWAVNEYDWENYTCIPTIP